MNLRNRLVQPLPGIRAQNTMLPPGRTPAGHTPNPPGSLQSAVLLLVTPAEELVYIRRADNGGRHSGQIAFPGGMVETSDRCPEDTALRETEEEIGVSPDLVEILGRLSPIYIPVSRTSVQPVVGRLRSHAEFRLEPLEIDEVMTIPVNALPGARTECRVKRLKGPDRVPCYRFGEIIIWGATAMITAEFLAILGPGLSEPGDGL